MWQSCEPSGHVRYDGDDNNGDDDDGDDDDGDDDDGDDDDEPCHKLLNPW